MPRHAVVAAQRDFIHQSNTMRIDYAIRIIPTAPMSRTDNRFDLFQCKTFIKIC